MRIIKLSHHWGPCSYSRIRRIQLLPDLFTSCKTAKSDG